MVHSGFVPHRYAIRASDRVRSSCRFSVRQRCWTDRALRRAARAAQLAWRQRLTIPLPAPRRSKCPASLPDSVRLRSSQVSGLEGVGVGRQKGSGESAVMFLYLQRTGPAKREPTPAEFPVRCHGRAFFRGNSPLPGTSCLEKSGKAKRVPFTLLLANQDDRRVACLKNLNHSARCPGTMSGTMYSWSWSWSWSAAGRSFCRAA